MLLLNNYIHILLLKIIIFLIFIVHTLLGYSHAYYNDNGHKHDHDNFILTILIIIMIILIVLVSSN